MALQTVSGRRVLKRSSHIDVAMNMKRLSGLSVGRMCMVLAVMAMGVTAAASDRYTAARQIDSLIYEGLPVGTDIALMVYDLTDDTTVYAYREDVMCRPASVQKVVTSTVALASLGKDFQFETRLAIRGGISSGGVLDGDVWLVGGLDPALCEQDLRQLASALKSAGVRKIKGTLYADVSMMDSVTWGPGWCWDDAPASFQPYISPLMVHGGYVSVQARPTEPGKAPSIGIYPQNSFIKVENKAVTRNSKAGSFKVTRDWMHDDNTILVSGNVSKTQSKDISVSDSQEFTFSLFREYLDMEGVSYSEYAYGQCPALVQNISVIRHSLTAVIRQALKESDNLYAECMFLRCGKLSTGGAVDFSTAASYTDSFVGRQFGLRSSAYNIVDGSGLSMYDFMTPRFLIDMLSMIYSRPEYYEIMYPCLPVSGVDGTMKTRLSDRNTLGRVHAKTGSVTGACTLAGYVRTASGHDLAFSIMNGGAIKMAASRKLQDQICTILCNM